MHQQAIGKNEFSLPQIGSHVSQSYNQSIQATPQESISQSNSVPNLLHNQFAGRPLRNPLKMGRRII